MDFRLSEEQELIRSQVRELASSFPDAYWREARLYRLAPISQELVLSYLAEHILGLPCPYYEASDPAQPS